MPKIIYAAILMLLFSTSTQSADDKHQASNFAHAKADTGSWAWIPLEDTLCRDGSKTGIGVRLSPGASAVMIYLQGGGACYDAKSCAQNASAPIAGKNFSRAKFYDWVNTLGNQGVFNTKNSSNPVAGWNHVYVPYCTGDLHGGDRKNALVPGVPDKQQFVGYRNLRNILKRVAPYFRNADDVALIGASAGGFGVLINYPQVVEAFGGRSVAALVDSAPIIPESAIRTSCFQRKVITTFDLQLPDSCPECADPSKGGLLNLYSYLSDTYPHGRYAFASADADLAGVILYNDESLACGGAGVNIFNYRFSLYALRDKHIGYDWATFLPGGLQHTMTQSDALFLNRKFRGVSAGGWLSRINDKKPFHVPAARLVPKR
ncbi:MAG: pectin acetylesterase-family hydrolase [Xanthomonadales bacterium]|nr:pectin acetylesterase-family hydrolase [Xanthomonadales bacterium]